MSWYQEHRSWWTRVIGAYRSCTGSGMGNPWRRLYGNMKRSMTREVSIGLVQIGKVVNPLDPHWWSLRH